MDELTSTTTGLVALGAAVVAALAFLWALVLAVKLRRVRSAQKTILGGENRDLVAHGEALQREFDKVSSHVADPPRGPTQPLHATEARLDGTFANRSLIRYDAYGETSGRQSTTIALLDGTRSGIVLSLTPPRDPPRLYANQLRNGEPEHQLSPEETEAVRTALKPPPAGS